MVLGAILIVPMAAAIGCLVVPRGRGAAITIGANAVILALALRVAALSPDGAPFTALDGWLSCDALGAMVLLLVGFVGLTAAIFSAGYLPRRHGGAARERDGYYPLYNAFVASMLAVPVIANIALVWIAVALTTLISAFLVAYEDTPEALEAAWKYVILTTLGAVIALLGVVFLYWGTRLAGSTVFTWAGLISAAPRIPAPVLSIGFILMLIGFGTKAGIAPMHTWLPDAHSQAPASICALLSGVETTTALYAVLRLFPVMQAGNGADARGWFLVFGLMSAGAAALLMIHVTDYKRMFAFSTVEHMGIVMVAVGLGAPAGFAAAFQIASHALAKSFCFFGAGAVVLASGTQEIAALRGLIRASPAAAGALLIGGFAIAGAPPFAVFMSEFAVLKAGLGAAEYLVVGLLALFIVIAFCAMMQHVNQMVFGRGEVVAVAAPLPATCLLALALAALPVLVLGLWLPDAAHRLLAAAAAVLGGAS